MSQTSQVESAAFRINQAEFPVYTKYQPLGAGHIRLLTISREKRDHARLHGRLTHHDLMGGVPEPEYHALSYYWGAPGETRIVVIDGEEVHLRKSLWMFLDTLCSNIGRSDLTIWLVRLSLIRVCLRCMLEDKSCSLRLSQPSEITICSDRSQDVLCINQKNTAERNAQVEMMAHIYRQALDVLAWVGEGTADLDFGMDYLARLESGKEATSHHQSQRSLAQLALAGLQEMFLHPYWTRVWIVQESVLNQDFYVYCGHHCVEWDALVRGMQALRRSQHNAKPLFEDQIAAATVEPSRRSQVAWSYMELIDQARTYNVLLRQNPELITKHLRPEQLVGQSILGLALLFEQQECLEVRDTIYGFRGLATNATSIEVDYSCRTVDLMMQLLSSESVKATTLQSVARRLSDRLHLTQIDLEGGMSDLPHDYVRMTVENSPIDKKTSVEGMRWSALDVEIASTQRNPRWRQNLALMRKQRKAFPLKIDQHYFRFFKDTTYGEVIFYVYTEPDRTAGPQGKIYHAGFYHEHWKSRCETRDDVEENRRIRRRDVRLLSMLNKAEEICMILQLGARMCRIRPNVSSLRVRLSRWALFALASLRPERQQFIPDLLFRYAERNPNLSAALRCKCKEDAIVTQGKPSLSSSESDLNVDVKELEMIDTTSILSISDLESIDKTLAYEACE